MEDGTVIYRLLNPREVEEGIREMAREDAEFRARLIPLGQTEEIALPWPESLHSYANHSVARVVTRDGKACGPRVFRGASGQSLHELLPEMERERLRWIYVAAFALQFAELAEEAEDTRIQHRGRALRCGACGTVAGKHNVAEAGHEFRCPHGEMVTLPVDCITDHADVTT